MKYIDGNLFLSRFVLKLVSRIIDPWPHT
ncbi:unnamed protein product [Spirodela intermedia]|uniref:Uncharacterized protein n=1 Tax=Spirodela intermedia TaxID=51605 RepID=A0A7I8LKL3_SPIIN|nr:unnamed protein product [Spirodela intermedia]